MLKINRIKFEVNTSSGLYGEEFNFNKGLNIIRGDNTSGKSSLFQSILYCLGFEELIGGKKNAQTMQTVLKETVEYPKDNFHKVLQSFVFLEIENSKNEIITIKRSVVSSSRASQLVDVYFGKYVTDNNTVTASKPMYIHDKGGASDETYGFHLFLENFLEIKLPFVYNKNGDLSKLYLQQIAPAFIIEQKTGWSGFLATMPHYGMTNKEARVIELLLDLDVYNNKKGKRKLIIDKRIIEEQWLSLYKSFNRLAERGGGKFFGIEPKPSIINDFTKIAILLSYDEQDYNIQDFIELQQSLLSEYENKIIPRVSDRNNENIQVLEQTNDEINAIYIQQEMLSSEINLDKNKLKKYEEQIKSLEEDLQKNKGVRKVKRLGAEIEILTANDTCPTCNQSTKDTLLPIDIQQSPMNIDENIQFVEAQIKMIKVYIDGQIFKIQDKEHNVSKFQIKLSELRQLARQLKKELISDDRLPSEAEIEKKLNIKKRLEFYTKYLDDFNDLSSDLEELSLKHKNIIGKEKDMPKDFFSIKDRDKLNYLKNQYKRLLTNFDYKSIPTNDINISMENYLPVVQKQFGDELKNYDLRFDSSASDFIRCIWAYTCSIFLTSQKYNTSHPMLLMFDEPKQQDISMEHFKSFLQELSRYSNSQIFVFASFENSDKSYKLATDGVTHNLKYINEKLIKPI